MVGEESPDRGGEGRGVVGRRGVEEGREGGMGEDSQWWGKRPLIGEGR